MDAESTDISEGNKYLCGAKEENDQSEDTPSSEALQKNSCSAVSPENLNKDSCIPVMLLRQTSQAHVSVQRGKESVPPETESLQSLKAMNEGEKSLSGGKEENNQCDDSPSSETLKKDIFIPVSPFMPLGPTTHANGSIQTGNKSVPPENEPLQSTKKMDVIMNTEITDIIEPKDSLSGTKKGNVKCDDTASSETLTTKSGSPASPVMLLDLTTQTKDSIKAEKESVSPETESLQSSNIWNINNAETTYSIDVKASLSRTKEENDQCDDTPSSGTLNKDRCNPVMLVGPTTQINEPIQTGKRRIIPEAESMQSPKTTNINNDAEIMHCNEGNQFLSGGKETYERCGDTSSFESCNHISPAMLLGPTAQANGSFQTGKGSVPPETEPLQSTHIMNTDTEATDGNETEESLSNAKEEYDQSDDKPSSKTKEKDSFNPDYPVMLLDMTAEANASIQTGNKSMPPENEPLRLPKTMNVTTDSESTDNNEIYESVSDEKEEDEQYDDTHSSENLSKDTCSSFCPVLPPDPTTQTNGSIQTGEIRVPPETESLQSPKVMNLSTNDATTDINQVNRSLSGAREDINQCDDSHASGTLNKESCNLVSPVLIFGLTIQENGTIQREKRRVPPETESFQSPKKMYTGMDAETTDSNEVKKFVSGNDIIKGKNNEKRIPEDAVQQIQNDDAMSECYVKDRDNLGTLEEQDHTCGFPRKEDLKPVHIDVQKNGTYTTETKISSSALERVSTEMAFHNSEIGALDEQIYATIYGQCIGDAIGLLTEFMSKDSARHYYGQKTELEYKDKIGDRHRKRWEVGDWTDDSDQMILIMQSLIEKKGVVNPNDFARRLVKWMKEGFHELGDNGGLGIGHTTYITITREGFEANPHKISKEVWEDSRRFVAPNGGVMRTSILGIHTWWDTNQVYGNTIDICKTTHFDPRCQASAVAVCVAISLMLQRGDRHYKNGKYVIQTIIKDVFREASTCLEKEAEKEELMEYLQYEDLSKLKLDEESSIGYTYKCLGAGFWALKQTDFRKALQNIAMSGGDADTNGAVAGALLGCKLGSRKCFPESWLQLKHKEWLDTLIQKYLNVLKKQQEEWNCVKNGTVIPP